MTSLGDPAAPVLTEREVFGQLRVNHQKVVPVVGSGLTADAGAPGFSALLATLRAEAVKDGADLLEQPTATEAFDQVEMLVRATSEEWVATRVASIYSRAVITPTPTLMALAKVRSGLIITTNYDTAIEEAANQIGRPSVSLGVDQLRQALDAPTDRLRVLHLHGLVSDPSSIVLSKASYSRVHGDERVSLLLRDIGLRYQLVFLGHSLASEESHIRRDLAWVRALDPPTDNGAHILIADKADPAAEETALYGAEIENSTGVRVSLHADPARTYQATRRAAAVIAGPAVPHQAAAEALPPTRIDQHYVPVAVGDYQTVRTPGGHGSHMYETWRHGPTYCEDLDSRVDRLALVGPGGTGKTEELIRIGLRSSLPALLQPVAGWVPALDHADPSRQFVTAMSTARGVSQGGGQTPQLTGELLDTGAFVFLLDGLDEIPTALGRRAAVSLINQVADLYPQHRYVVSSRPLAELDDLVGFEQHVLMPDGEWLERYCSARGLAPVDLQDKLPVAVRMSDVLQIPVYAAAAVNRVIAGDELPATPLRLICSLADERTDTDNLAPSQPGDTRVWLDRVAVLMEAAETSEVPTSALVEGGLHTGLSSIKSVPEFIEHLITRALLNEDGTSVRFPANVLGEARAGRAILDAGELGLAFLQEHALVALADEATGGASVRAVRLSWVNTLERLLEDAPQQWRDAVAAYDPLLAAGATPASSSVEEREAAIWTIWNTYDARLVWMSHGSDEHGQGDLNRLHRLLSVSTPPGFMAAVEEALGGSESTGRGNALMVLPTIAKNLDSIVVLDQVRERLTDEDSVVRRLAAVAAKELDLVVLSTEMAAQANIDEDKMAAETLLTFAMDLVSHEVAIEMAMTSSTRPREAGIRHLRGHATRAALLEAVTRYDFSLALLEAAVEPFGRGRHEAWDSAEVSQLATIVVLHTEEAAWKHEINDVLRQYPQAAARGIASHSLTDDAAFWVRRWVSSLSDQALTEVEGTLASLGGDPAAVPDTIATMAEATATQRSIRAQPTDKEAGATTTETLPTSTSATAQPVDPELVNEAFANGGVAAAFDPKTRTVPTKVVRLLEAGAAQEISLGVAELDQLFAFLLNWRDHRLEQWFAAQCSNHPDGSERRTEDLIGDQLIRAAELLPSPWAPGLSARVLEAASASKDAAVSLERTAHLVAERDSGQALREWAATHPDDSRLDEALVRLGDAEAEARLLRGLTPRVGDVVAHRNEHQWISDLRQPGSAPLIVSLIRSALVAGKPSYDLNALYDALTTCAGLKAVTYWDALIADPEIPGAAFLHHQRRRAIDVLVQKTKAPEPESTALQSAIRDLVPRP